MVLGYVNSLDRWRGTSRRGLRRTASLNAAEAFGQRRVSMTDKGDNEWKEAVVSAVTGIVRRRAGSRGGAGSTCLGRAGRLAVPAGGWWEWRGPVSGGVGQGRIEPMAQSLFGCRVFLCSRARSLPLLRRRLFQQALLRLSSRSRPRETWGANGRRGGKSGKMRRRGTRRRREAEQECHEADWATRQEARSRE